MRIRRQKICGNRVSTTNGFRAHDRSDLCIQAMIEEVRFAEDSPLLRRVQIPTKSPADSEMMSPGDTR